MMRRASVSLVVACLVTACAPIPSPSPTLHTPSATLPRPTATVPPTATVLPTATVTPTASPTTSARPTATPAPSVTASCAERTLASLTEPQRIGQLFMIGLIDDRLDATERAGIAKQHFGSVVTTVKTSIGVDGVRRLADAVQAEASDASTGGIGFLVATNQEGGLIQSLAGPGFDTIPSAVTQGRMATAELETSAERWGRQLAAAGVNVDLAPVADVVPAGTEDQNAPIGQLRRGYGPDPKTVASHVAAFISGMRSAGIATSAKHFPGLGRVVGNTDHTGDVRDAQTTRNDAFLRPFEAAVQAQAPFVMVSLATYERIDPGHLAVFSPTIIGTMLRHDWGFRGVVISDALGAAAVQSIPAGERAVDFIQAGGDMIISNHTEAATVMAKALSSKAASSPSFKARIDEAALHVLVAKDAAGLLPCD
jgi:beta-N-acetylhexosaminidase